MTLINPVSELLIECVDYRNYPFIQKSALSDYDEANELDKMTKRTAVQTRGRSFSGNEPLSIITFLQDFKTSRNVCSIHDRAAMSLFKCYSIGSVKFVITPRVALSSRAAKAQEGFLSLYLAIINYILKIYRTHDKIAPVDGHIQTFEQQYWTATDYTQLLCPKTFRCESVYT